MQIYYFLGIGGIGMSALARYYHRLGYKVSGYDHAETSLTKELISEGIEVHYDDNPDKIPQNPNLVIYTPAVPKETKEFQHIIQKQFPLKKRSEVLGEITRRKTCIAVAGSHGKTTVSTLIAHLLNESRLGCNALLGGISKNFNSNILVNPESPYVVVEADEFDRSFLQLYPYYTVITSADPDHLDIYENHGKILEAFSTFANQTQQEGTLFIKRGIPLTINDSIRYFTYSFDDVSSDFYVWNVRVYKGSYFFDLRHPNGTLFDLKLNYPGLHNIENSVAAIAVAMQCGLEEAEIRKGLQTFAGVKRRFDYRIKTPDFIYIDDYAHHPKEIEMCIKSVRNLYPSKRITGVFQPHLYSRTRDFADEFARALELLDEVILLDIYPAREQPIKGIDSKFLLTKINKMDKYLATKEQLTDLLKALNPEVLLTLGAGDIDKLVASIEKEFS